MRNAMRWLSVVGGLSFSWALPAMAEQPTPVDCGSVECEGIREMKALHDAELALVQETDRYTLNLAEIGFAPAACADGSRAPVPGPGWVAGCHFAYRVTAVTGIPNPTFTAVAQGAAGTPAAGLSLEIGRSSVQTISFWMERAGVRRSVGWDECLPAASFTCSAQQREGVQGIRNLFITEVAFFNEKDRYSSNLAEIGFVLDSCTDGTRAAVPDSSWTAGCRFIYRVDLTPAGFVATARAVSGAISGTTLKIFQDGALSISSIPFECQ